MSYGYLHFFQINRGLQHAANVTSEGFILTLTKHSQMPVDPSNCWINLVNVIQLYHIRLWISNGLS